MSFNLNGLLCFKKIKKPNYNRDQWVTNLNSLHPGQFESSAPAIFTAHVVYKTKNPNWISTDSKKRLSK